MANVSPSDSQDDPVDEYDLGEEPNFDVGDEAEIDDDVIVAHALPVPLGADEDEDDDEYAHRKPIVLDLGGSATSTGSSGSLDLSALIGQFDAAKKNPPKPAPAVSPPVDQVFDVSAVPVNQDAELNRLRSELEAERKNVLRAHADMINLRRKSEQERERAVRESSERVVKQLLPIIDDFERSLSATSQTRSYDQLADGVEAILRNFATLLNRHGIEPVPTVGIMFDPDIHEAVSVDETSDQPEDIIVEELRKGYRSNGRLLRAALVKVAKQAAGGDTTAISEPDQQADAAGEQVSS